MWLRKVYDRIATGQARAGDVALLTSISQGMEGRTLCALGDFAIGPVLSSIKHFPQEYEHHLLHNSCPPGTSHAMVVHAAPREEATPVAVGREDA